MKKLILKACCCLAILQATLAVEAQTSLSLITFNEANATYAQVGSTIQQGALFQMKNNKGALSPENNRFSFLGSIDNSTPNLYTIDITNGSILYTAPATFVDGQGISLFRNYHYSDAVGKLIGIYSDNTSASVQLCDIQTGALTNLFPTKKSPNNAYVTAYSHVSETFYYMTITDSMLHTYQPGTGVHDSLQLGFTVGSNKTYHKLADLQYDDVNNLLYILGYKLTLGIDLHTLSTVNLSTGALTNLYPSGFKEWATGSDSYQWVLDGQSNKYLAPHHTGSGLPPSPMLLSVVDITNQDDTTFYLKNHAQALLSKGEYLTNFEYNYLTGQIFGLRYFDSTELYPTPTQPICLVSADPTATYNIVTWEKTDNDAADSFYVYRETATNVYTRIAAVHGDSLSEFYDLTGNPNSSSYRYKISILDTFGHEGELSPYHNTIHVQYLGGGNVSWNQYTINGTTPVSTYDVLCDSLANGNWYVMLSVPGNQTTATDVDFANHTGALYRVVANFPFSCTAARSASQSYSNVISQQTTGLEDATYQSVFAVYPNPAGNVVTISVSEDWLGGTAIVSDVTGRQLLSVALNNSRTTMLTDGLPTGLYTVTLVSANRLRKTAGKPLVIQK